jgi:aerobic carbon-monoxide dehydrogenase small subunit
MKHRVEVVVNGGRVTLEVEPRKSLADALREDLGLTGTHLGCEQGVCGACTVIANGEGIRSCLVLAAQCDGWDVRTIEGIVHDEGLHPVQRAFHEHHALQCGFCTPGFVTLAVAALERDPALDRDAIVELVSSNLCRCTGYESIVRALETAADDMQRAKASLMAASQAQVRSGQDVPGENDLRNVRG